MPSLTPPRTTSARPDERFDATATIAPDSTDATATISTADTGAATISTADTGAAARPPVSLPSIGRPGGVTGLGRRLRGAARRPRTHPPVEAPASAATDTSSGVTSGSAPSSRVTSASSVGADLGAPAAGDPIAPGALVPRGFHDQYRDNVARLAAAQKSGHGVPPYTRYVNRWLGRRLAAMAAILRLTPNAVTGLSMLASYLGMALLCLVEPGPVVAVGVTVLLLLGYALDSADGQVARLSGRSGPAGEWLDHVTDQARTVSLHMAVLIWLYRFVEPAPALYLLPMAWAVVTSARFLSQILGEQFRRAGQARTMDEAQDRHAGLRAVLQLPSDTGVICAMFLLVGLPMLFLQAYAALLILNGLLALVSMRRRYVELRPRPRRV